jgi:hypothetical protein
MRSERLIRGRRRGAPGLYGNLLAVPAARNSGSKVAAEVDRTMIDIDHVAAREGIPVVPASMEGVRDRAAVFLRLPADSRLQAPVTLPHRDRVDSAAIGTMLTLARCTADRIRAAPGTRYRPTRRNARSPRVAAMALAIVGA